MTNDRLNTIVKTCFPEQLPELQQEGEDFNAPSFAEAVAGLFCRVWRIPT